MFLQEGGLGDLAYPLVSDLKKEISQSYGVLSPDGIALRGEPTCSLFLSLSVSCFCITGDCACLCWPPCMGSCPYVVDCMPQVCLGLQLAARPLFCIIMLAISAVWGPHEGAG